MQVNWLSRWGEKPWFVVLADFCGVNTSTMADFELPIVYRVSVITKVDELSDEEENGKSNSQSERPTQTFVN